jgi:hypothetical protein
MNNSEALDLVGKLIKQILNLKAIDQLTDYDLSDFINVICEIYIDFLQRFVDCKDANVFVLNDYYKVYPEELTFINNLRFLCSKLHELQPDIMRLIDQNQSQTREWFWWLTFSPAKELILTTNEMIH